MHNCKPPVFFCWDVIEKVGCAAIGICIHGKPFKHVQVLPNTCATEILWQRLVSKLVCQNFSDNNWTIQSQSIPPIQSNTIQSQSNSLGLNYWEEPTGDNWKTSILPIPTQSIGIELFNPNPFPQSNPIPIQSIRIELLEVANWR